MGIRELREKYGRSLKGFSAVNAAIRAEIPGAGHLIDALAALHLYLRTYPDDMHAGRAMADLQKARHTHEQEIARKYDLATRPKDDDAPA